MNKQSASNRMSSWDYWDFNDQSNIQFSQFNIDLHADVDKLVQICDLFIECCSLKIWADFMLKII